MPAATAVAQAQPTEGHEFSSMQAFKETDIC